MICWHGFGNALPRQPPPDTGALRGRGKSIYVRSPIGPNPCFGSGAKNPVSPTPRRHFNGGINDGFNGCLTSYIREGADRPRRKDEKEASMKVKLVLTSVMAVALAACDGDPPLHPQGEAAEARSAESKPAGNLGVPNEITSHVYKFPDMEIVESARAGLLRGSDALHTRTHTAELSHGHVMTLWWIVFNHPEHCEHGAGDMACGELDLFDGPEGPTGVEPGCVYADGSIVGGNGTARFHDRLSVGESRDSCIDFFVEAVDELDGEDHGLTNPAGAEVHLVVRSHGPRIPGMVREQRSTFAGGCETFLGAGEAAEDPGDCADLQFAVFP